MCHCKFTERSLNNAHLQASSEANRYDLLSEEWMISVF